MLFYNVQIGYDDQAYGFSLLARRSNVKNAKKIMDVAEMENNDEESSPSCQTRRKIEDLHELRRYQDELGVYEDMLETN